MPRYETSSSEESDETDSSREDDDSSARSMTSDDAAMQSDSEEHQLLRSDRNDHVDSEHHELRTAPIITRDALTRCTRAIFPQRGLLGRTVSTGSDDDNVHVMDDSEDRRLYVNTNTPFSAVVCGVQGSGKSHTTSVLLESMLIPGLPKVGSLKQALSGLVLHFGEGGVGCQPSEAAWLARPEDRIVKAPRVVVFVSPSSLQTMRTMYAKVSRNIIVEPLLFRKSELDAQAFLSLMAVQSTDSAPLYMQTILSILRALGEDYTYDKFTSMLEERKRDFLPGQKAALRQRMDLLESFLDKGTVWGVSTAQHAPRFVAGQLTIVDLTDPFIDSASACGYFEILTRLFVRANVSSGKVLVVDEAHKYLGVNSGVSGLTKELVSLVRQLRHQGTRVIISTQEPTVIPPVLIDLCGVLIMHRFSSPSWLEHVAKHVSANMHTKDALDRILRLKTGQAVLLAPSGLGVIKKDGQPTVSQFGRRWILVKTRRRVTKDGGASVLSVQT